MSEKVSLINPCEDPRWDAFVDGHPYGWICHSSKYRRVLEASFRHIRGYCLAKFSSDGTGLTAALPVFEVQSWITGHRLVSIPFATLCDPLATNCSDMAELVEGAIHLVTALKCRSLELRSLHAAPLVQNSLLGRADYYKHHYLLLDADPMKLRKNFHRSCVRQRIDRAGRSGVVSRVADDEQGLREFYRLHLITRKKLCLPAQPYRFLKNLLNAFGPSKQMRILLGEYKGRVVAGLILFQFRDRVSAEFAATDPLYFEVSPNHYLFWEAINHACKEGYKIFDFGRTSPTNTSLLDFKRRWGTLEVDLPQFFYPSRFAIKTGDPSASIRYTIMRHIIEKIPMNAMELIGDLCYRHLG
jgi:hypothetical protein